MAAYDNPTWADIFSAVNRSEDREAEMAAREAIDNPTTLLETAAALRERFSNGDQQ